MPNDVPRDFTCQECGSTYRSTKKRVNKRRERLGTEICVSCIKKRHDAVQPHPPGPLPECISLVGKKATDRTTLTCKVCDTRWETDRSSGEILFRRNGRRFICTHCQYDAKAWATNRIEVTCEVCGKMYRIDEDSRRLHENHRCYSCCQQGKTITKEQRAAISKANSGRRMSEEDNIRKSIVSSRPDLVARFKTVNHLSPRFTGRRHTEETKALMRSKMTQFRHSDETKAQMRTSRQAYIAANGGTLPDSTKAKIGSTITRMRMEGFKPESGHVQEVYEPKKPQPAFLQPRTTPYTLSSSWESILARWLDECPEVTAWSYEAVRLQLPDGRPYLTDFVFMRRTETGEEVVLVEVKPRRKIVRNVDRAREKVEVMTIHCADCGWLPLVADEEVVAEMRAVLSEEARHAIDALLAVAD